MALLGLGYEKVTGISSAKALTVPSGAYSAVVGVSGAAVRWRCDGDPTTAEGVPIADGGEREFVGSDVLRSIKFIEQAGTATLYVHYLPKMQ